MFVSYSRKDKEFVSQLVEALSANDNIHVLRDTDDILPTEEWKKRLEDLISQTASLAMRWKSLGFCPRVNALAHLELPAQPQSRHTRHKRNTTQQEHKLAISSH